MLGLGLTRQATGDHLDALTHHEQATALDQPTDLARAHAAIAATHRTLDRPEEALHHWRLALTILTDHDISQIEEINTADVRAHLAAPDHSSPTATRKARWPLA
ncbi:tetratricopeptide (TPR) repeat protein [Saccharomonospora amisosensis]|uniref:Tetratricopeptide (TPR) repeat protein n=1 Tax=Saccharomonospora amisosensis TaxID=1128677 RepID=A0A7X5UNW3_9PSEU|nr:hypothetical protein [Saccharomonospora amisosensis]NIJ11479.1 tetratricopeptide (TPR) repeat protein [Saccharomonospora amisosensis]